MQSDDRVTYYIIRTSSFPRKHLCTDGRLRKSLKGVSKDIDYVKLYGSTRPTWAQMREVAGISGDNTNNLKPTKLSSNDYFCRETGKIHMGRLKIFGDSLKDLNFI